MQKWILHVDMDAFFASCELRKDPSLKGKPVAIGADPKQGSGRGVLSTANYEARKYGLHSAMPVSKAYRLCPHCIFLRGDFEFYCEVSNNVMNILRCYTKIFQKVSIDEAYLDITDLVRNKEEAELLAKRIKSNIQELENITCSIGIGPNKLIAKTASDYQKPDGLTIVENKDKADFLAPMPIRKLRGVGKSMEQKLKKMNIHTIKDLAEFNKEQLISRFGVYGNYLILASQGIGSDTIKGKGKRVTLGHERTFFKDTDDEKKIEKEIERLSEMMARRLSKESQWFRTVSIKVRLEDFSTFTRSKSLNYASSFKHDIHRLAIELFEEFRGKKLRLIGVRVSNLEKCKEQTTITEYLNQPVEIIET